MRTWILAGATALALLGMVLVYSHDQGGRGWPTENQDADDTPESAHTEEPAENLSRAAAPLRINSDSTLAMQPRASEARRHDTMPMSARPLQQTHPKDQSSLSRSDDRSPWTAPGQCVLEGAQGDRVAYLSEFVEVTEEVGDLRSEQTRSARLWAAPGVSREEIPIVRSAVATARSFADYYDEHLEPPAVYLHNSLEELRKHACVAASALSYYDGSIHVAMMDSLSEMETNIRHEYAHHILSQLGFRRPVWLHEGFAQRFAGETKGSKPVSKESIDLTKMVEPLSVTSSEEEVAVFYAQASDMLEFLNQLPPLGRKRGYVALIAELRQALAQGTTVPEDLFVWATMERGESIIAGDPVAFWKEYLASGGFDDDTLVRIEEVRRARHP